jgi:ribonuclease R
VTVSEKEVIEYFQRAGDRPVRYRELAHSLGVPRRELRALKQLVRRLRAEGKLERAPRTRGGMRGTHEIVGRLQGTRRRFGFILREDAPDVYVRLEMMRDAVHGDLVRARLRRYRGRLEAVVEEVVERARKRIAGTLERANLHWILVPDDDRIGRDIHLGSSAIQPRDAQEGHKALVHIVGAARDGALRGEIETVLGMADAPGVRTAALMAEFDLPEGFDDDVLASIDAMKPPSPPDLEGREDLAGLLTFTIDPFDARDHDDAVSIERLPGGGFELGVHIADVAHYVRPGSPAEREAERRATSVYLADRVVPMLPEALSNHVCSLRPGVPRLVQSAIMRFDARGVLHDWRLTAGWIVSRVKLSYEAAEALLKREAPEPTHWATSSSEASGEPTWSGRLDWAELRQPLTSALADMRHLAAQLRAQRMENGSLDIETPEYKVMHDARGRVVDINQRAELESYSLVEEFMLAANCAVASSLNEASLPLLWRIHGEPQFHGTEELRLFLKKLGLVWVPQNPATNRDYQILLRSIERRPERRYLMYRVLRSLQKAEYSRRHLAHFGLAFAQYTHFTSPIRRYPDLHNHRLVRVLLERASAEEKRAMQDASALASLGRHATEREILAAEAERASLKLKVCEFLSTRLGEEARGFISAITDFGFFVDVPEWNAEGLVHYDRMNDDEYAPDTHRTLVRGSASARRLRFGQQVSVRLVRVDPDRRQVDLCLAS